MLVLFAFIPVSIDCIDAYTEFLIYYNKSFNKSNEQIFCTNFAKFLKSKSQCINCTINVNFDKYPELFLGHTDSKFLSSNNNYHRLLSVDPLPKLQSIPESVDLREMGLVTKAKRQLYCGSCWAFATIALLENSILHDHEKITQSEFNNTAINLDLSEQYLMSNVFSASNYCQGGNSILTLNYMLDNPKIWKTVETTQNFPYEYEKNNQSFIDLKIFEPKVSPDQYLIPYKVFNMPRKYDFKSSQKTPVINLLMKNGTYDIQKVQQYLARGLAVGSSIYIENGSQASTQFRDYSGDYVIDNFTCKGTSNHAIVLVGYGKFKNQDVWIAKNSWGEDWGNNGFMYIARGQNTLCVEYKAFSIIPKHYDKNAGIFNQVFATPFNLTRGKNGLDINQEQQTEIIQNDNKTWQVYVKTVSICLALAILIAICIVILIVLKYKSVLKNKPDTFNI
ncbi:Cathepsin L [Spironucleus salmonicida]|uniref:Cathepsin L n=1 Tax=Spironucleus salmonicida TaxID=348837 RepID=V6LLF5_9EUKA|nr:Cathepsin L [Spironucleus salmonicida]|eukprot:EST44586.1 Cathepsin L [Spironucleus salmonicida]